MREKFNPYNKFCSTRPDSYRDVPAVETKSMELADGALFFAIPSLK